MVHLAPIERPAAFQPGKVMDMSVLAGRPIPVREWLVPNLIPRGKVVLLTGDGGLGKSLLAQQLLTAVATGRDWLGFEVPMGPVFGLFCEDDEEELWRRQADINDSMEVDFEDLHRMWALSGVGNDFTLMTFTGTDTAGKLTPAFEAIMETLRRRNPTLVVIDTLADTFGGNEIIRNQVRTFINGCLGKLAREIGCTVVLLGHPSQAGKATGDGTSGSTAWNNSVRARLYLERPPEEDADPDERVLTNKKQNYGPSGGGLRLRWRAGAFELLESSLALTMETSAEIAERAYLEALAELEARGEWVSPAKNQATYAPKIMVRMQECRGHKLAALVAAQDRLFRAKVVKIETSGRRGHERRRITFTAKKLAPFPGGESAHE